jgi:hypothetical protein
VPNPIPLVSPGLFSTPPDVELNYPAGRRDEKGQFSAPAAPPLNRTFSRGVYEIWSSNIKQSFREFFSFLFLLIL